MVSNTGTINIRILKRTAHFECLEVSSAPQIGMKCKSSSTKNLANGQAGILSIIEKSPFKQFKIKCTYLFELKLN